MSIARGYRVKPATRASNWRLADTVSGTRHGTRGFSVNGAIQASLLQRPAQAGADADGPGRGPFARTGALMRSLAGAGASAAVIGRSGARTRRRRALGALPWALLGVAAVLGALLAGASALVVGCLVVLACAATALGWQLGERDRVALEDEIEHRTTELETRALRARDRPGRDRSAPVDGGRVPRRGHRRAHRADRALLGAAGRTHRHGRRVLRAPPATRRRCTTSARWRSPTRSCSSPGR